MTFLERVGALSLVILAIGACAFVGEFISRVWNYRKAVALEKRNFELADEVFAQAEKIQQLEAFIKARDMEPYR